MYRTNIKLYLNRTYRIGGYVEEAGSTATAIEVGTAEKVLLSMASNLSWCPCLDIVP